MIDLTRTYIRALRDITEEIQILKKELDDLEKEQGELINLVENNQNFKERYPDKYMKDYQHIKNMVEISKPIEEKGGRK